VGTVFTIGKGDYVLLKRINHRGHKGNLHKGHRGGFIYSNGKSIFDMGSNVSGTEEI